MLLIVGRVHKQLNADCTGDPGPLLGDQLELDLLVLHDPAMFGDSIWTDFDAFAAPHDAADAPSKTESTALVSSQTDGADLRARIWQPGAVSGIEGDDSNVDRRARRHDVGVRIFHRKPRTLVDAELDAGEDPGRLTLARELNTSDEVMVVVSPVGGGPQTVEVRVGASSDDAEEDSGGGIDLTSSDLELVQESSTQTVGMRFVGVAVPKGASIENAYIQFQVDEVSTIATSLTIQGQAHDDAPTFTTGSGNVSSRIRTGAAVSWSPPGWPTVGVAGSDQQTSNIAPVIAEIVGRAGWLSGQALVVIISGTGERVAESYNETPAAAALLHIEYVP